MKLVLIRQIYFNFRNTRRCNVLNCGKSGTCISLATRDKTKIQCLIGKHVKKHTGTKTWITHHNLERVISHQCKEVVPGKVGIFTARTMSEWNTSSNRYQTRWSTRDDDWGTEFTWPGKKEIVENWKMQKWDTNVHIISVKAMQMTIQVISSLLPLLSNFVHNYNLG